MNKFWHYMDLVRLSAGASLLIGLGDFVLLKIGAPVGPFLFAFGLMGVCVIGLNLFTGKCGFWIEDRIKILDLVIILVVNLISGYLFGVLFGVMDNALIETASVKVSTWEMSPEFFLKSAACGAIMYLAVDLYRRGSKLGILLGVPLFIFCGFQHSIANVITMGVAVEFSWTILLCAAGNFVGAIVAWSFCRRNSVAAKLCSPSKDSGADGIKIHDIYKHFKGDSYIVDDIVTHSETGEKMVQYRSLYDDGKVYVRPYELFVDKVNKEKYPNATQEYRFELQNIESKNKD